MTTQGMLCRVSGIGGIARDIWARQVWLQGLMEGLGILSSHTIPKPVSTNLDRKVAQTPFNIFGLEFI